MYRGVDTRLGRPVAVKIFRPGAGSTAESRFREEARLLGPLEHPCLVTVYDAGVEKGRAFLVLQLVDGVTLARRLAHGPLSVDQVVEVGARMSDVLAYVHSRDIVHRDVKPGNVLVDEANVYLADFGISRLLGAESVTAPGVAVGTAAYMAPEQIRGQAVGPAADVYSLGLVLIECLTGRTEYPGGSVEAALARLSRRPRVPAGLPEPLREVLLAMTVDDPELRPTARRCAMGFARVRAELGGDSIADFEVTGAASGSASASAWASDAGPASADVVADPLVEALAEAEATPPVADATGAEAPPPVADATGAADSGATGRTSHSIRRRKPRSHAATGAHAAGDPTGTRRRSRRPRNGSRRRPTLALLRGWAARGGTRTALGGTRAALGSIRIATTLRGVPRRAGLVGVAVAGIAAAALVITLVGFGGSPPPARGVDGVALPTQSDPLVSAPASPDPDPDSDGWPRSVPATDAPSPTVAPVTPPATVRPAPGPSNRPAHTAPSKRPGAPASGSVSGPPTPSVNPGNGSVPVFKERPNHYVKKCLFFIFCVLYAA